MTTTSSCAPVSYPAVRGELLELLHAGGIIHRSATQPVVGRDGVTTAPWMLDSLSVSLSARGAELAGQCLLHQLERFEGRQLATLGITGVPLLQACVMQSGGRHHGLILRPEPKGHGACRQIEGRIDPNEPVVIIDDSVSSGTSMSRAIDIIEAAGLWVEGGVCLVRFNWNAGFGALVARGYHLESVYDVWEDFIYRMEGEVRHPRNPTLDLPDLHWADGAAEEGLHPAQLARRVMTDWLEHKTTLRPPERLNSEYDAAGGVWVSLRARDEISRRHARDGFWLFAGDDLGRAPRALTLAAAKTAATLPAGRDGLALLETGAVAVTFFGALEPCTVGQLDNDRFGIVVCSRARRRNMGGALPRMPGIADGWQQLEHARTRNARLLPREPHVIYRHDVHKVIEPGVRWQPTGVPRPEGVPWYDDPQIAGRVARRSYDLIAASRDGRAPDSEPLPDDLLGSTTDSIYLTLYDGGHLRGCHGRRIESLDADVAALARSVQHDNRFASRADTMAEHFAVTATMLHGMTSLGERSPQDMSERTLHGRQALMVYQDRRMGVLLPAAACAHNLSPAAFVHEVIDKAGITHPPYRWLRFDCASWLAGPGRLERLSGALPASRPEEPSAEVTARLVRALSAHLLKHQREGGSSFSRYQPFRNSLNVDRELGWCGHGAWILARAAAVLNDGALRTAADNAVEYLRGHITATGDAWLVAPGHHSSVSEVAALSLALGQVDAGSPLNARLNETLWSCIDHHGRIRTHRERQRDTDAYQDYYPGQVLLALAHHLDGACDSLHEAARRAWRFYRHRFRYRRHWGQVGWLMQACAAWYRATGDESLRELLFEIGDWALGFQQEVSGGFINGHAAHTPSALTAVYLEGIAAALPVAVACGDEARRRSYSGACTRGFRFLDRLVYRESDALVLPSPEWAMGGLRVGLYRTDTRPDLAQHALGALLSFLGE